MAGVFQREANLVNWCHQEAVMLVKSSIGEHATARANHVFGLTPHLIKRFHNIQEIRINPLKTESFT
jgi:hypothetical protein